MPFVTHSSTNFRTIDRKLGEIICWPEKTDKTEKHQEYVNIAVQDTNEKSSNMQVYTCGVQKTEPMNREIWLGHNSRSLFTFT